jgi:hypothetical protein
LAARTCPACGRCLPEGAANYCNSCGFDLSGRHLPSWVVRGVDLRAVAQRQRRLLGLILAIIAINLGGRVLASNPLRPATAVFAGLALIASIMVIVDTVRMLAALRTSLGLRILFTILMLLPLIVSVQRTALAAGRATVSAWRSSNPVREMLRRSGLAFSSTGRAATRRGG